MEALSALLTCPVCVELFNPPVLLLSCSHNFCRKCLEPVLAGQNCTRSHGHFCCPMCRKVIFLRGKGINEFQRNILAENILEKFKDEIETLHTKEQNQLTQLCEKHGEVMNLMCLTEEEPICGMCKLFGDHQSHQVAKISDACTERKLSLAVDLQRVLQEAQQATEAIQDTEQLIGALSHSAADVQAMLDAIGDSLLDGIRGRKAALRQQLERDLSAKMEKLQLAARKLGAPQQLYQQMKGLLQHPGSDVHFLQEHKRLKAEMETLVGGSVAPQAPPQDNVSIRHYFQELIKGIDFSVFPKNDAKQASTLGLCKASQKGQAQSPRPHQALEISSNAVSDGVPKGSEQEKLSGSPGNFSGSGSWAHRKGVGCRESTV